MSRKQRSKTIIAVIAFGLGVTVLSRNLWLQFHGPTGGTDSIGPGQNDAELPPMGDANIDRDSPLDASAATDGPPRAAVDLLAAYGSYRRDAVPNPFLPGASEFAASPSVEPALDLGPGTTWDSNTEPPQLTVSLIMVTDAARRASVDGVIVGIGDAVNGGKVTRIGTQGIEVETPFGRLFYDLDDPYPREFRREQARRQAQRNEGSDLDSDPELPAESPSPEPATGVGSRPWLRKK